MAKYMATVPHFHNGQGWVYDICLCAHDRGVTTRSHSGPGWHSRRASYLSSMSRVMWSLCTQEGGASIRCSSRSCTAELPRSCWRRAALSISWAVEGLDAGSAGTPAHT